MMYQVEMKTDMKVWVDTCEGLIMFQHYEKPMASVNIMHAESAISVTCQHSVHTQEIMRRLLNSSPLLDWKTNVAPVISEYCGNFLAKNHTLLCGNLLCVS